jgi:transposase InsO family protein
MELKADFPIPIRPYFRPTTISQRQLLFKEVGETGNVTRSALKAHVGRGTYYHWKSRYKAEGMAGLMRVGSRAPRQPRISPISTQTREEVLAYHRSHPQAGYRTIANRICQAHGWQKVISHSKVREIIVESRTMSPSPTLALTLPLVCANNPTVVHAQQPEQTLNIDLCVVPVTHDASQPLASVSVSEAVAGAVPETKTPSVSESAWPGQVFGSDTTATYSEQMQQYVEQRKAKRLSRGQRKHRRRQKQSERAELKTRSEQMRIERRRKRARRRQEDAQWRAKRKNCQAAKKARQKLTRAERRSQREAWKAQQATWQADKAERNEQLQARKAEDATWREERRQIKASEAQLDARLPPVTAWFVILVVVDNCTRHCVGVPLFPVGVPVTAELIVAALRPLCPPGLEFIISDNGAQFIAGIFEKMLQSIGCIHVRITPHRPKTNGIAERFVRTLKEWLARQSWNTFLEMEILLDEFKLYYNERPHQGAELDGLSPNEFAQRLKCSTS